VVERPSSPPPPPPGPSGPPPGGPPPGAPVDSGGGGGKGKGPLIAIAALVVVALGLGAFFLLGGDDDESAGDDTTTTEEADDDTTTTADPDDTTTTAPDDTTTTTIDEALEDIDFVPVTDATGALTVEVPSTWTDQSLELPNSQGLANIQASTDLARFRTNFDVPGTSFSLFPTPPANGNLDEVLDFLAASVNLPNQCTSQGKQDYDDGVFVGRFEVWAECAGIGTQFVQVVASQADGRTIEINVQLTVDDPVEIATHIAETFLIIS
jgi:hypothetical protein